MYDDFDISNVTVDRLPTKNTTVKVNRNEHASEKVSQDIIDNDYGGNRDMERTRCRRTERVSTKHQKLCFCSFGEGFDDRRLWSYRLRS